MFGLFQLNVYESAFASGMIDWKVFYGDIEEEIPTGMLEPLGKSAHVAFFVEANHAGNTQNSHIGVLIYVMNMLITWFTTK